jgi:hypothetical protein
MNENNRTITPEMSSYEEIDGFWDMHSLIDYCDQTEPTALEIEPTARRRCLVAVDPELLRRARQIAHGRGLTTECFINLLLEQRLREVENCVS